MLPTTLKNLVESELLWRERELTLAKVFLQRSIGDDIGFRFAYRCFTTTTYAHYEGLVKRLIAQALDEIGRMGTKQMLCNRILQLRLLTPLARRKIETISNEDLLNLFFLNAEPLNQIPFPQAEEIIEISNMNFERFKNTLACIGLDATSFESKKAHINRLTYLRHLCAHGEEVITTRKRNSEIATELFELHASIIFVMHALCIEIIDHFEKKSFEAAT